MMKSAIGTKFPEKFGVRVVVGYEAPYRIEAYTSFVCEEMFVDRTMALGPDDNTPSIVMSGPNRVFDDRCMCCTRHIAHTERVHQARIFATEWRAA